MDKQTLIDSIKNFLSVQLDPDSFSDEIYNIIDELSKTLSQDLYESISSIFMDTTDSLSPRIPEDFIKVSQNVDPNFFFNPANNNFLDDFICLNRSRYIQEDFVNITPYSGFDSSNPQNARQNNYAWSFVDFNDFIYVGTGRNLIFAALMSSMKGIQVPLDYIPSEIDMGAEIWRYKKDGSLPWQKVYKSPINSETNTAEVIGIRSLIKFDSFGVKPALYAAAYSTSGIKILKSTNGVDWFDIPTGITEGTSSRSMMIYRDKIYLAVMSDSGDIPSLLYSSKDPELFGWKLETPQGEEGKNPKGTIWSMIAFNNHIYLGTSGQDGFMLWRTNSNRPKVNDWKLVIDKGAGDASNATAISLVEFKNKLYIGTAYNTTSFMSYIIPKGAEIIRIDKNDNWNIIVGGPVMSETEPETGTRKHPLSGFANGFFNPYNLYIWQMKVYNNKLFIGTYDSSSALEPTYELLLKNKELLSQLMDEKLLDAIILFVKLQIMILSKIRNQMGFDFYVTEDGINYSIIDTTGFHDPQNYGIRNIFISDDNTMYIGTANPFSGCNVYRLITT